MYPPIAWPGNPDPLFHERTNMRNPRASWRNLSSLSFTLIIVFLNKKQFFIDQWKEWKCSRYNLQKKKSKNQLPTKQKKSKQRPQKKKPKINQKVSQKTNKLTRTRDNSSFTLIIVDWTSQNSADVWCYWVSPLFEGVLLHLYFSPNSWGTKLKSSSNSGMKFILLCLELTSQNPFFGLRDIWVDMLLVVLEIQIFMNALNLVYDSHSWYFTTTTGPWNLLNFLHWRNSFLKTAYCCV